MHRTAVITWRGASESQRPKLRAGPESHRYRAEQTHAGLPEAGLPEQSEVSQERWSDGQHQGHLRRAGGKSTTDHTSENMQEQQQT